jgi:uncharacterized protein
VINMDWLFIVIPLVLLIAGLIKGFSGFATSIILSGVLVMFYEPKLIVPILALMSLLLNLFLIIEHVKYIKNFKHNFALRPETIITLIVGIVIGTQLLVVLDTNLIKFIFALMMIVCIWLIKHKVSLHGYVIPRWETNSLIGFFSGLFSGLINVNGPPFIIYSLWHKYDKIKILKSVTIFFLIADMLSVLVFYIRGMYSMYSLSLFFWFLPFVIIGFYFGQKIRNYMDDTKFKKYIIWLLLILALKLIIDSVMYLFS